jgi:hypothetical protein
MFDVGPQWRGLGGGISPTPGDPTRGSADFMFKSRPEILYQRTPLRNARHHVEQEQDDKACALDEREQNLHEQLRRKGSTALER